ncbi:MAG: alpha/beta hydrolase [Microthrixaceae bacterium]
MDRRAVGAIVGGVGLSALAAATGIRLAGTRIRERRRPDLDELLAPPSEVRHHTVATSDGGSLHVVSAGHGPPLVLLHGVTLQWWTWSPLFHLLADRCRVVAWDMRGHGRSEAGSDGVSLEATGRDLVELLEALELHDAVVVGHSMGGMAMGRSAIDHPDRLVPRTGGLVFLSTATTPVSPRFLPGYLGAGAGVLAGAADRAGALPVERLWRPGDLSASLIRVAFGDEPSSVAIEAVRQMIAAVPAATSIQAGEAILNHDLSDDLGNYGGPALVIVGSHDHLTPLRLAERTVALLPQAELQVVEGAGHQVMQEAPHLLAELIDRFARGAVRLADTG